MGTWSHEPFGNDTANDWAYELDETTDFSYIERTLDKVLDNGEEYLDASDAEEAIAAVEVLAKALGKGTQSDSYTEKVEGWLKKISAKPAPKLLDKAKRTLERILSSDSELLELWEESDDAAKWKASIAALQAALRK